MQKCQRGFAKTQKAAMQPTCEILSPYLESWGSIIPLFKKQTCCVQRKDNITADTWIHRQSSFPACHVSLNTCEETSQTELIYHKMCLFSIKSCQSLHCGTEVTNVSSVDPAGPPLGLVIWENEPCIREALEEDSHQLFCTVLKLEMLAVPWREQL